MKKFHENIEQWGSAIENRWKLITPTKQRKYIVLLFTIYLLITIGAMLLAWQEGRGRQKGPDKLEHITNPLRIRKNSKSRLKVIHYIKNYQLYERTK
ncbi:hypothetical protein [Pedobacter sp. KLB.chiD]|uniref:hypothetical protein n=1 Tax=Pedobacter sp. KLB.chiD TaxID=3387402 RepID=UPI00399BCE3C